MTALAIVGTGPCGFGIIYGISEILANGGKYEYDEISVYDKAQLLGAGLPYNPRTTDPMHLFTLSPLEINVPTYANFYNYLNQNQDSIRQYYRNFFAERLEKKLQKTPRTESQKIKLRAFYELINNDFESRYLIFDSPNKPVSRMIYGIYANQLFEQRIAIIRSHGIRVNLHPATEISTVTEDKSTGTITLGFNKEQKEFARVAIAVGEPFVPGDLQSPKYFSSIWPSEKFSDQLEELLNIKIAKGGDERNKTFLCAIQGGKLSSVDAIKSVFKEGIFERNENGFHYTEPDLNGYRLKVEILLRHNPLANTINPLTEEMYDSNEVGFWKVMLASCLSRSLEERDLRRVAFYKNFAAFLIKEMSKNKDLEESAIHEKLDQIPTSLPEYFKQLHEFFALEGKASYPEIFDKFKQVFLTEKFNSDMGFPNLGLEFLREIYFEFYNLDKNHREKLSGEDSTLITAYMYIASNFRIPTESMEELWTLAKQGLLSVRIVGQTVSPAREENEYLLIETEGGEILQYDAIISAKGLAELTENPFYKMLPNSTLDWDGQQEIPKNNHILYLRFNDLNLAFSTGKKVASALCNNDPAIEKPVTTCVTRPTAQGCLSPTFPGNPSLSSS